MSDEVYDIAIIGGGPVGQYAAYYAGLRGMKTQVIDSLPELGGQLTALYPEKYIYDVAGLRQGLCQGPGREPDRADDPVRSRRWPSMRKSSTLSPTAMASPWRPRAAIRYRAKSAVIACGVGAFMPRKMAVAGVAELDGLGIHYFVRDKSVFAGKRVMIVGGGDSAFDWSLNLFDTARRASSRFTARTSFAPTRTRSGRCRRCPSNCARSTRSSRSTARTTSRA